MGGTWFENIYPGVRCDIPANVYQSTFSPNTQWTEEYAEGHEILAYWKDVAKKYDVYRYLKLSHKVTRAEWDEEKAKWVLRVTGLVSGREFEDEVDVLINAVGIFNTWKLPDYPGIKDYQGHLRHTSNWDPTFEPKDKTIAVIGNGASGIQVLPQLHKTAKRIDHYARHSTWITAGGFGPEERNELSIPIPPSTLTSFSDPTTYHNFRKNLEQTLWRSFSRWFKGTPENAQVKKQFTDLMIQRTAKKPDILKDLVPDFDPLCRRPTPGIGYLETLVEDNVEFIREPISHFTKSGIVTKSGVARDVDAVICSTGARPSWAPPFPTIANGIDLNSAWEPNGLYGFPYTYLGVTTPDFPNFFYITGPNSFGLSGTVPHAVETVTTYIAKVLRKLGSQGIRSIVVKREAADDFVAYSDAFFPRTVLSGNCSSWYNGGNPNNRIHGVWPGSASHVTQARFDPRWEDFNYTYKNPSGNRFAYFGNGWTKADSDPEADATKYLKREGDVDLRSHHENWFEVI